MMNIPFLNVFKGKPQQDAPFPPQLESLTRKIISVPKSLGVIYTPSFDTFAEWSRHHRDHQKQALRDLRLQDKGQVCLPTGTGKTRVQVALHAEEMINLTQRGESGVFVTAAHRLALCGQLLEDMIAVAVNAGIPFDILFIGSTRFSEDKVHAKFKNQGFNKYVNEAISTTRGDEVRKAAHRALVHKRHLLGVSTYHSFDRLSVLNKINIATYDEAHTIVSDKNFMKNIEAVRPIIKRNFFFTATRRIQGDTEGMNNEGFFGKVLCEMAPRTLINAGEIVPPKLHLIRTAEEGDYTNHTMLVKTVTIGFEQHRSLVKKYSTDPDSIGAKMLITTTGNKEMMELHNDVHFREFCAQQNIKVFAYSAEYGAFYNFEPKSRDETMDLMRGMKDSEDAIMLHIDILTEGINLPSITGVMPFRELNTIKLLQTIGRAGRLLDDDRRRLYAGELFPMNWEGYVKPCSWVIFPENYESLGNAEAMKNAIRTIINEYEVPVEEYNIIERYLAPPDEEADRTTKRDQPNRKDKETDLVHIIEDVLLERYKNLLGLTEPHELAKTLFS